MNPKTENSQGGVGQTINSSHLITASLYDGLMENVRWETKICRTSVVRSNRLSSADMVGKSLEIEEIVNTDANYFDDCTVGGVDRDVVIGPPRAPSRLRSRSIAAYLGSRMNLGTES